MAVGLPKRPSFVKQGFVAGARLAIAVSAGAAFLAVWPGPGPLAAPVVRAAVLEGKTLEREEDHLVVVGSQLRALQGVPLSKLRLLAQTSKGFRVIPYQVDERRDNGDYVWDFGEDIEQDRDRGGHALRLEPPFAGAAHFARGKVAVHAHDQNAVVHTREDGHC